jgi:hypothetical protein
VPQLFVPSQRTPIAKAPGITLAMNGQRNMDRELVIPQGKNAGEELRQELMGRNVLVKYDDRKP